MKAEASLGDGSEAARGPEACACFKARRAARAVTKLYDDTLAPCGLRTSQFAILTVIHARGIVSMQAIAAHLGLDPSTMTRSLRPLEKARLVRVDLGADRRVRTLALTPAGRQRLARAHALWRAAQARLREKLGAQRLAELMAELDAVTDLLGS